MKAVKWSSKADGVFTVESGERSTNGTDVILHLKSDEKEFLEPWRIKEIVKNIQIIYLTLLY